MTFKDVPDEELAGLGNVTLLIQMDKEPMLKDEPLPSNLVRWLVVGHRAENQILAQLSHVSLIGAIKIGGSGIFEKASEGPGKAVLSCSPTCYSL